MAVYCDWNQKMGEYVRRFVRDGQECQTTISIYKGNCLGVEVYEYPDGETVQLAGFWNDEQHLKRCLGLGKDSCSHNLYDDVTVIRLNTYFAADIKKIAKLFTDAVVKSQSWNLHFEFYYEEPKDPAEKRKED